MSAPRTKTDVKKKKLGSRRYVSKKNEPFEDDELNMDSTSVTQHNTSEENTESLNILTNPDESQSEDQHQPSSGHSENRRKLGSSRINKGRQHVKDPETKSYHKTREEVEGKTKDNEGLEKTHMSLATQFEKQEELSQVRERDTSPAHVGSLYSATIPGFSSKFENTLVSYPEDLLKMLIPKSENLQAGNEQCNFVSDSCKPVETMLKGTDKSDTLQSEEVKENEHLDDVSVITSFIVTSCPTIDEQVIDQSDSRKMLKELHKVYSATEKEHIEDTDLSQQDGNLHSTYLMRKSHMESVIEFSATADISRSPTQTEELPADEYFSTSLASQPLETSVSAAEQTDTIGFNLMGNRRKLGYSHRNKGRQHDKDSVADTYYKTKEEVAESVNDNEAFETEKMSLLIQTMEQVKSTETSLEGEVKSHTHQTEKCSSIVKETAQLVGISELDSSILYSSLADSQQLIDAPGVGELPDEFLSVYSVTEKEKKERQDTDLLSQQAVLQVSSFMIESCVHSENVESSITPEITTEISSLGEHTEPECRAEQAIAASQKELSTNEEPSEHLNLPEVRGAHRSEDAATKVDKQVTQIESDYSFGNSDVSPGNLKDQAEFSDTQQSELPVKCFDHSANSQEVSNPDSKQNEYLTKEKVEPLDQISEVYNAYDTKKPHTRDIKRVDTGLSQVYETECKVEEDIKFCAEQTSHHEKEGLYSKGEKSESLQTMESEIHTTSGSQTQDTSMSTAEQKTHVSPIGSRRKLGSRHRKKRKHHIKDSLPESFCEDQKEDIDDNEDLETTKIALAIQTTEQEELSKANVIISLTNDSSLSSVSMPGYSSEVQNPTTTNCPKADLEGLSYTNEYEPHDFKVDMFNDTVETSLEGRNKSNTESEMVWLTNEEKHEHLNLPDVGGACHSEDAVKKVHKKEVKPSQMQEMHEIKFYTCSGNLKDQVEFEDTQQYELMATITDNPLIIQDVSNPNENPGEHPTKESNLEVSPQINEDHHVCEAKKQQSHTEKEVIAGDQVYEIEYQVEDDIKPSAEQTVEESKSLSSESMPGYSSEAQNSTTTNCPKAELEGLSNTSENVKEAHDEEKTDFKVEVFNESVAASQEEMGRSDTPQSVVEWSTNEENVNKVHEQQVQPTQNQEMHEIDYSFDNTVHNTVEKFDTCSGNLTDQAGFQDTQQSELTVKSTDNIYTIQEILNSDENQGEHPTKENNLLEPLDQISEVYYVYDTNKSHSRDIERIDTGPSQVYETECQLENDIKPSAEQTIHQEKEGLFSKGEKSESSLQTLESEAHTTFGSQPQDTFVNIEKQNNTDFNPTGKRRKLGSRRGNKGHHHVKLKEKTQETEHDFIKSVTGDSSLYSVSMPGRSSEVQNPIRTNCPEADLEDLINKSENVLETHDEKEADFEVVEFNESVEATLEGMESDTPQSNVHDKEIRPTHIQKMSEIDKSSESELSVRKTDESATKQDISNPDKKYDHPTKENNSKALDQINVDYYIYDTKKPQTSDIERLDTVLCQVIEGQVYGDIKPAAEQTSRQERKKLWSLGEHRETECSAEQAICSSPKEELSTNEEQNEHFNLSEDRGAQHSKDSINKVHEHEAQKKRKEAQEISKIDYSSESGVDDATENSVNPEGQAELKDTHQSELHVKSTDDSNKQEILHPGKYKHPSEYNFEALDQKSEDIAEHTDYQKKEELFSEVKESECSLRTLKSEIYAPVDPQSQDNCLSTDLLKQWGILQAKNYESELHLRSESIEPSVTLEKTTERSRLGEHSDPEWPVEQATLSSSKEELSTNEKQNEHFSSSEVIVAQHTEKVYEEEFKATPVEEMHQINYMSAEKKLTVQAQQLEGHVPLDSQPQDHTQNVKEETHTGFKLGAHRRKLGTSRRNKGRHQVLDSATETYHDLKDDVGENTWGDEASEETKASLETETTQQEELKQQTDLGVKSTEKMRKKLKEQVQVGVKCEDTTKKEQRKASEAFETTKMSVVSQTMRKDKLSEDTVHDTTMSVTHDSSLYPVSMPGYPSEVQSSNTTNYPETYLESLNHKSENLQEAQNERQTDSKEEMSIESTEATLEEIERPDSLWSKEIREANNLDDDVNKDAVSPQTSDMERVEIGPSQANETECKVEDDINVTAEQTSNQEKEGLLSQVDESKSSLQTLQLETHTLSENLMMRIHDEEHSPVFSIPDTENIKPSVTLEKATEKSSPGEHKEPERSVEQATLSSSKEELSTNEEQNEHFSLSEVIVAQHTENAAKKVYEEEFKTMPVEEMHQINYMSAQEKLTVQAQQLEGHVPLDSQPQDHTQNIQEETHTGFKLGAHRRKLGSSRRNKGRHQVLDSATETYHELKDDVGENTWGDEASEETKASVETVAMTPEELKQQTDTGVKPRKIENINDGESTKKIPEEDTTLPQHVLDNSTILTTDITSNSDKDYFFKSSVNEEAKEHIEALSCEKALQEHDIDVDVSKESGIFTAVDAHKSQQDVQEKTHLGSTEPLEGKSKQKRRKMGSTRKTQLSRKQEGEMDDKDVTKQSNLESNMIPGTDNVMALLPEQSASPSEDGVTLITFVHQADIKYGERNVGEEPSQLNNFSSTEMKMTSVVTGRNRRSINQLLPPDTDDAINPECSTFCETEQGTQNDEQGSEAVNMIQSQVLKSSEAPAAAVADLEKEKSIVRGAAGGEHKNAQAVIHKPNNMNEGEGVHNSNIDMKSPSPNFNSTNKRRKMGSTRRNPGSLAKREDLHQKQEVDNEMPETVEDFVDVLIENASGTKDQPHKEHQDSEQKKEKERVEYSHIINSQLKPLTHQPDDIDPVSLSQVVETEPQMSPDHLPAKLSTSPKQDVMSESTYGGRRRKLGSHRKSRGNQTAREDKIIDAQKGLGVGSLAEESGIKTNEENREESLVLDKISEIDESDKTPLSNISSLKAGEASRPVREKAAKQVTPVTPHAEIRLEQDSHKNLSLVSDFTGAEVKSKGFNVLMVGDTSVGKSSFMKRAQSGKFSLDLPASVGLDSCKWTVVVDGKPVVLHLWDTAGQERFHSITRQVFHKAQAFLLMYDITSSKSFAAVSYWANCIQEGAAENVTILLIGNKSDRTERQVKTQEGEILAKEYNFEFMECSAATGENVIHCLETMARILSQKADTKQEAMVLNQEPRQKKRSGCC